MCHKKWRNVVAQRGENKENGAHLEKEERNQGQGKKERRRSI